MKTIQDKPIIANKKNTEYSNDGDRDQIVNVKTNLPKRPMTTANPNLNKREMQEPSEGYFA